MTLLLLLQVIVFQYCNTYVSLFYIAFFKGRGAGYPGNYSTLFGFRLDDWWVGEAT